MRKKPEYKSWMVLLGVFVCVMLLQLAMAFQYRSALPGYQYRFPRDHAAHPGFKTEWWYYTGHLQTESGRPFGYELTFFRSGVLEDQPSIMGDWTLTQVYPAHFAISDIQEKRFVFDEKLNRGAAGIAGARDDVYYVWNELWFAELLNDRHILRARSPEYELHLMLTPEKAPVIHGENGISQKASCAGCTSHYYSMTRLRAEGVLFQKGQAMRVTGLSWMDHEFGSNQLAENQVGWDWFSIQLNNKTELMLYLLRQENGDIDPNSSGTLVLANGQSRHLRLSDFQVEVLGEWKSPTTGGVYPMGWRIQVPDENIHLTITPTFEEQELTTSESTDVAYWEGTSSVSGSYQGQPVHGQAYVELTGYAEPFRQDI